jgi:hypothetical protein
LPLLPDALLSVADVQALVASEPNASASNTKTADKIRDAFMVSLLMTSGAGGWPEPGRPRAGCGAAMYD